MKRFLTVLGAVGATLVVLPMFAAFEAHVVNVTATIENAMSVQTRAISFGTTFPEEVLNQPLSVGLSQSFASSSADGIQYVIRQKPKCGLPIQGSNPVAYSNYEQVTEDALGNFVCPDANLGYVPLPLLCPFLSKHPDGVNDLQASSTNDGTLDAFHGPLTGWNASTSELYQVAGLLTKITQDTIDNWTIDLHVPCFKGSCAQDNIVPAAYQEDPALEHQEFGCDLWVETTGIVRAE